MMDYGRDIGIRAQLPDDPEILYIAFKWHVKLSGLISVTMHYLYGKNGICNSVIDIRHVEQIRYCSNRGKK